MAALIGKCSFFTRFFFELKRNFYPPAPLVHFNSLLSLNTQIKGMPFVFAFLHRLPHTDYHTYTCKYTLGCVMRVRVSCLFLCKWHFSYFSTFRYLFNFPLPFNSFSILDVGIVPKANCISYYSYFIY